MFDSIKSIFRSASRSLVHKIIRINLDGKELIALLRQCAADVYPAAHLFTRKYLLPFVAPLNLDFARQLDVHISSINAQRFKPALLAEVLERELRTPEGFVPAVLQLWYPYLSAELPTYYDAAKFFRAEVHLMVEYLLAVLSCIYGEQVLNPQQAGELTSRRFRLRILDALTDSYEFQKIKTMFVKKCKLGRGTNGDFTPSQVKLNTNELNHLVKFKEIPAPFHQSIKLMLEFYQEHRIQRKVQKLVLVVEKAKQQILEYREFFGMGGITIGSDQVMPVINYICERTGKNIFASIQYVRALLGGRAYSEEECALNLKAIAPAAAYCVDLVESMSTIYCHASQMCQ